MSQHLDSLLVLVILIYSMSEPGTGALQMRVSETGRHTIISECITSYFLCKIRNAATQMMIERMEPTGAANPIGRRVSGKNTDAR